MIILSVKVCGMDSCGILDLGDTVLSNQQFSKSERVGKNTKSEEWGWKEKTSLSTCSLKILLFEVRSPSVKLTVSAV